MPAPPPVPITNDVDVLKVLQDNPEFTSTAAEIAVELNLTPFQVTARLKSMENRGLVARANSVEFGKGWFRLKDHETVAKEQAAQQADKERKRQIARVAQVSTFEQRAKAFAELDKGVPIVNDTNGWKLRYIPIGESDWVVVFLDPHTGTEYTHAMMDESAHLIRAYTDKIPSTRLRRFDKTNQFYKQVKRYIQHLERAAQYA